MSGFSSGLSLIAITLSIVVGTFGNPTADSYFKQVSTTDEFEMMGKVRPATSDTSITWMTEDRVYHKAKDGMTIGRFDLGLLYMIDHNSKTYTEIPLKAFTDFSSLIKEIAGEDEELMAIIEEIKESGSSEKIDEAMAEIDDPELAKVFRGALQALIGPSDPSQPMMVASVTPTDETKTFGSWLARRYDVEMTMPMINKMTSEIWATEQIDVNYDRLMQASMGMAAGWSGFAEAMEEFKKVKGMVVYSTVSMKMMGMNMNITSELLEYREADPPSGIYEIPEGYSKVELRAAPKGK